MIICFTGNGNSRLVADRLATLLQHENVVTLRGSHLREGHVADLMTDGNQTAKRIIWVFPVYSWGVPPAVADFIKALPDSAFPANSIHYLVLTCGDDTGMTHHAWRRLITRHGWLSGKAWSVQMPNTYTLLPGFDVDSAELVKSKLDAMPERIASIAREIEERPDTSGPDDVVMGSLPRLKSSVVYPLFVRYDIHPDKFHASDACIGCGRCAATCPLDNITLDTSKPVWGSNCTLCLGCYNCCPERAIDYGRRSQGKGQYFAKR